MVDSRETAEELLIRDKCQGGRRRRWQSLGRRSLRIETYLWTKRAISFISYDFLSGLRMQCESHAHLCQILFNWACVGVSNAFIVGLWCTVFARILSVVMETFSAVISKRNIPYYRQNARVSKSSHIPVDELKILAEVERQDEGDQGEWFLEHAPSG